MIDWDAVSQDFTFATGITGLICAGAALVWWIYG